MLLSNFYDLSIIGISTIIGFGVATMTLVMGLFLIMNEVPVEYEGYRNSTFLWAAALLFFIATLDNFIDRTESVFMLLLFAFYVIYIYYRTEKSKEYIYLKTRPTNILLYPLALFAVIISSFVVVGSVALLGNTFPIPTNILGLIIFGVLFSLPMLDVIKKVFKSSKLTFDSIIGNVVITLTLIPGISAFILPIAYQNLFSTNILPLIFLNVICISFAMLTRTIRSMHRRTGYVMIAAFILYVLLLLFAK
jgi:Ca2+/Na+ antiporter